MNEELSYYPIEDQTEWVTSPMPEGGCPSGYLIPPISVLAVGLVMILTLSQVDVASTAPLVTATAVPQDQEAETQPQAKKPKSKKKRLAPLFTPEVRQWEPKILNWSNKWGLNPNLVATVMQIESCGDPRARSSAGAMGLFQVMPFHFAGGEDPYLPGTNAQRGLSYLKQALESSGGNIRLAFAGYNGGITGAKRPQSAWPAETVRYVYWGTGIYEDAIKGKARSERLNEWMSRGGASLCRQAAERIGLNP